VLWFEMFYAPVSEMPVYVQLIEMLGYKKLYWNYTPKPDAGEREGEHVYLNCVIERACEAGDRSPGWASACGHSRYDMTPLLYCFCQTRMCQGALFRESLTSFQCDSLTPLMCHFIARSLPISLLKVPCERSTVPEQGYTVLNYTASLPCGQGQAETPEQPGENSVSAQREGPAGSRSP